MTDWAVIAAKSTTGDVIFWCLVLIGGILILGIVVKLVRRWSLSTPSSGDDEDWSLQHLRDLRAKGQITEHEFETLKSRMLMRYRAADTRKDRAPENPSPDDFDGERE